MKRDIDSISFVESTRGGGGGYKGRERRVQGEGEEGTRGGGGGYKWRGRRREDIDSANIVDDIAI